MKMKNIVKLLSLSNEFKEKEKKKKKNRKNHPFNVSKYISIFYSQPCVSYLLEPAASHSAADHLVVSLKVKGLEKHWHSCCKS
jgi:carbohydrate-selective porin OprB